MIRQGEVHWVRLGRQRGPEPGYRRPGVIVQNDAYNTSRIPTVVVALLTSTTQRAAAFGNVTLRKGEAGLPRRSVVNISQIATIDRTQIIGRIGELRRERLDEVLLGIQGLLNPVDL